MCQLVVVHNFVALGRPSRSHDHCDYLVASDSGSLEFHQRAWRFARRFVSTTGGEIPSIGRGRANLAEILRVGSQNPYHKRCCEKIPRTVARDVEIERIASPSVAGTLRPIDIIPLGKKCPERAHVVADLNQLKKPVLDWPRETLRACHRLKA